VYINAADGIMLYINASEFPVAASSTSSVMLFCDNFRLDKEAIDPILSDDALIHFLHELYQQGYLCIEYENDNSTLA
jgi:hypothetical protein